MRQNKFTFYLITVVLACFFSSVWAIGNKTSIHPKRSKIEHKPSQWENFLSSQQQKNTPLTSDLWLSQHAQKTRVTLSGTGVISGRVTQFSGGAGIEDIEIYAEKLDCPTGSGWAITDMDGYYIIDDLPDGKYEVYTGNDSDFVNVYWNDKPLWGEPDTVMVVSNDTTPDIDFSLRVGGKITGTVTVPGTNSHQIIVYAEDTLSLRGYGCVIFLSDSSSISYEISQLPTSIYKGYAYINDSLVDEYYNNKSDWASADPLSVTEGATISDINFTLAVGGKITGTVTSSAKGPLQNISIFAVSTTDQRFAPRSTSTDASGKYKLNGLRTGYYKILARGDSTYAWEYYNGKSSWSSADSVRVIAPDSVSGKDFALDVGGVITGYVYGAGAVPIADAYLEASLPIFQSLVGRWTTTAADGSYKLGGLRTGYYWVYTSIECDEMWYNDESIYQNADSVPVTMPDTTSGINFNFPSAVGGEETQIPSRPIEFELSQNYPNPFNPTTAIAYSLQKKAMVNLEIYNLLGQRVKTLVSDYQSPGSYRIFWDGKNEQDRDVASGIYFYRLVVDGDGQAKKMVLMK
jgi:hypothetical protein